MRPGTDLLETIVCAEADDLGRRATRRFWFPGDVQALADLPAIRAVLRDGDVLLASVDGTETQPSERAVMVARGCEHLLAVAVRSAEGPMLVRLLADTESGSLPRLAPFARALLAHAARP